MVEKKGNRATVSETMQNTTSDCPVQAEDFDSLLLGI
jgi:hypothetical protein